MVVAFPDPREKPAHIIRDRVSLRIEMQDRPPLVRTPFRSSCSCSCLVGNRMPVYARFALTGPEADPAGSAAMITDEHAAETARWSGGWERRRSSGVVSCTS